MGYCSDCPHCNTIPLPEDPIERAKEVLRREIRGNGDPSGRRAVVLEALDHHERFLDGPARHFRFRLGRMTMSDIEDLIRERRKP